MVRHLSVIAVLTIAAISSSGCSNGETHGDAGIVDASVLNIDSSLVDATLITMDAIVADATNLDASDCHSTDGIHRYCICDEGAGQAITVACNPTTAECFVYNTTCIDVGFNECLSAVDDATRVACRAFCSADAGVGPAGCPS
ncbi:MAG: hypothetical protein IPK60_16205 [Sandaracinaceae bacterium]|nr:hypothetical protein [Sandaracinaceae bacterium]